VTPRARNAWRKSITTDKDSEPSSQPQTRPQSNSVRAGPSFHTLLTPRIAISATHPRRADAADSSYRDRPITGLRTLGSARVPSPQAPSPEPGVPTSARLRCRAPSGYDRRAESRTADRGRRTAEAALSVVSRSRMISTVKDRPHARLVFSSDRGRICPAAAGPHPIAGAVAQALTHPFQRGSS